MSLDSKIVTPVTSLEGWLVVAFVAIAFFVIALFAYKTQKKADSTASYFAAGRGVPWQVACLSLVASWTWATTTMAAGEGAYTHGFAASWYYPIGGGIGILIAIPILNRVRKVMPYGLTFPEFIRRRIGPGAGLINAVGSVVFQTFTIWLQIVGAGIVCRSLLGLPFRSSAIIIGVVTIAFSVANGLWGVLLTDSFQISVIVVGMSFICLFGLQHIGGAETFYNLLLAKEATTMPLVLDPINVPAAIAYGIPFTLGYIGYGVIEQNVWGRVWSVRTEKDFLKACVGTSLAWIPIPLMSAIIGMLGLAMNVQGEVGTDVIPLTIMTLLGKGGAVVGAIVILFALTSTMSSCICSIGTHIVVDFYEPYILKGKKADEKMNVKIGRWTMAIMGIVMVISTAREMSLMYINMFINCVLPPLFIPFIYAAFWKKVNKKGLTLTMFIAMVGNVILSAMVLAGTGVGANTPYIYSYVVSFILPIIITAVKPDDPFDYALLGEKFHV